LESTCASETSKGTRARPNQGCNGIRLHSPSVFAGVCIDDIFETSLFLVWSVRNYCPTHDVFSNGTTLVPFLVDLVLGGLFIVGYIIVSEYSDQYAIDSSIRRILSNTLG